MGPLTAVYKALKGLALKGLIWLLRALYSPYGPYGARVGLIYKALMDFIRP